ncbi:putative glycoside hydrolase [Candidatus Margulisiibacteriota bacterium]
MLSKHLKIILAGAILAIPLLFVLSFSPSELFEEITPKPKRSSEKGLYITYYYAKTPRLVTRLKNRAKKHGLNTLVIDSKWFLEKPFLALLKENKINSEVKAVPDPWLAKFVAELHEEGFIVTARLVVFKDDHLALARPDLGVKLKGAGEGVKGLYRDHKGGKWADPYSAEVRLYQALIAESAAMSGVDEIQFDYIRFPAEGGAQNAVYPFEKEGVTRVDAICEFLKGVHQRVKKYNVSIAVDIFGVTAWQSKNDIESLGQDLKRMAKYIDVVSPMLYPSHFHAGYDGFANPGSHPYYFLSMGVKKTKEILSREAVAVVPWLQGFNLRSPNFGPNYVREQIRACEDEGAEGYLIWNARNVYDTSFRALGYRQTEMLP